MFGDGIVRMHDDDEPSCRSQRPTSRNRRLDAGAVRHGHLLAEHPLRNVRFAEALIHGELHVAVAFVDLVASTAWAESLDPAEHSDALRRFEMRSAAIATITARGWSS